MKILFLCQRVPYPPNKGERIRAYHQIRWLAQRHEVHVLALTESRGEAAGARHLAEICASVGVFLHGRRAANLRAGLAAASGRPLTPAFFRSGRLAAKVREMASSAPPDVVVACSSSMAQYARLFTGVPQVLDLVDVDSAKWSQFAVDASLPWSLVYGLEARRLRRYEREQVSAFDRVAVTTGRELEKLRSVASVDNALILRQGVDVESFNSEDRRESETPSLVFTGQMDYLPNVAAVTYFSRRLFPRLRRQRPTLELSIVGRHPSPTVQALSTIGGIEVTGEVPDVRPYLERSWVFVAPLRVTMGVPTKILEAMAVGLPVAATEAAMRGLVDGGVQEGRDLLVGEDDCGLVDVIDRLLADRHLRERTGAAGRRLVHRSYSWEQTARQLEEVLLEVSGVEGAVALVAGAGVA